MSGLLPALKASMSMVTLAVISKCPRRKEEDWPHEGYVLVCTAEQRPEQRTETGVFQSSPLMGAAVLTVQLCHKTLPGEPAGFCVVELGSGCGIPEPHSVLTSLILVIYKKGCIPHKCRSCLPVSHAFLQKEGWQEVCSLGSKNEEATGSIKCDA